MTPNTCSLDVIQVASPCEASWDEMQGDDRSRYCKHCSQNVYNLTGMTRSEAEELLQNRTGRLCVRFFRRHDGTILTQDCPVGIRALRLRLTKTAITAATLAAGLLVGTLSAATGIGHGPKKRPLDDLIQAITPQRPPQQQPSQMMGNAMIMGDVMASPTFPNAAALVPPQDAAQ